MGGGLRLYWLVEREQVDGEVAHHDGRPERNLDGLATEQAVARERPIRRQILHDERLGTHFHDGVLPGNQIALQAKNAVRVATDGDRSLRLEDFAPLLPVVCLDYDLYVHCRLWDTTPDSVTSLLFFRGGRGPVEGVHAVDVAVVVVEDRERALDQIER